LSELLMPPEAQQILVIDHDAERRRLIEQILAEDGFTVTAVAEGFSAIRIAGARRFALALAAVELPGTLDGPATVRQMRARQPWLKALYTGEAAHRPWWSEPDCDDFIAAPFHPRDLLGGVFELLQREAGRAYLHRRDSRYGRTAAQLQPMRVLGGAALADLTGCRD
jgi:DNA-binding response OmpR family regulator